MPISPQEALNKLNSQVISEVTQLQSTIDKAIEDKFVDETSIVTIGIETKFHPRTIKEILRIYTDLGWKVGFRNGGQMDGVDYLDFRLPPTSNSSMNNQR